MSKIELKFFSKIVGVALLGLLPLSCKDTETYADYVESEKEEIATLDLVVMSPGVPTDLPVVDAFKEALSGTTFKAFDETFGDGFSDIYFTIF